MNAEWRNPPGSSAWQVGPPGRACRLCGATTELRDHGAERMFGLGQRLVRCGICGNAALDRDMAPAALERFYGQSYRRLFTAEAAERYDEAFLRSIRAREVADWRAARLLDRAPQGGRALELGSGYGAFLAACARLRPDLALEAVEPDQAHRLVALDGVSVRFVEEIAGPYDLIAAFHSLEHVPDPLEVLRRLRAALAPGGRLAIEVPDMAAPWPNWAAVHPAHLSYFTRPGLERLLETAGLVNAPQAHARKLGEALPGTIWIEAVAAAPGPLRPAPPAEVAALDARIAASAWRPRDALRQGAKRLAVGLLGPERVGAIQRRRAGPRLDAMLAQARGRASFFGYPLDLLTLDQTADRALAAMRSGLPLRQADINVGKLVAMNDDPVLARDVAESDIVSADGMGIVWGARLLGTRLPGRVTGIDLMQRLLALCAEHGLRPYILGAQAEVLEQAVARQRALHPGLRFAGWHHGYFTEAEEPALVRDIRACHPHCLFVAMPSPRKERFLARHHAALGIPFTMGVGGSVDVLAGLRWRAPAWMQRAGLEWLARLVQEPRRLGPRYLATNLRYGVLLARALITGDRP